VKQYKKLLLLLVVIFLPLSCGTGITATTEMTYVVSYSPSTPIHLLVRDRLKAAYERAGLKAEFIPLPHNRSLLNANEGIVDGDVGRIPLIEKKFPNLRRVDVKVMDFDGAAYVIDPKIDIYDKHLLSTYRVGAVLGVQWSELEMAGLNGIAAPSVAALFEMLLQGRVDLILATQASADSVLRTLGSRAKKVRELQPVVFSSPLYHYVNKNNIDIIPRLEQALKEINEEGVFVFYTGVQSPIFEILQRRLLEAFRRIGKTCEVRSTGSSQRALLLANEKGDGDAFRNGRIKEIAPELTSNLLQIPEPIGDVDFYVYTSGKNLVVTDWSSLNDLENGLRVGAKILEKNIPENQTRLPDTERLLMMLAENRLDTVTEHGVIADFKIQQLQLQGISKLSPPLVSHPGYSYIHKKHKQLIPAISASLAEMKKDGSFIQIEKSFFEELLINQSEGTP
jgi:polar amino acid transport system substrate-binding protein